MLKREIKPACEAMKKLRMPKFEDKELRNTIIKNHLFLLGQQKKYEQELEDLRTAHLGAYEDQLQELQELQNKLQAETDRVKQAEIVAEINAKAELRKALNELEKAQGEKSKEEVEVSFIDADKFTEEYMKQDYDCGVVEALYPMFSFGDAPKKESKK